MNRFLELINRHRRSSVAAGIIVFLIIAGLLYFLQTPQFPDDVVQPQSDIKDDSVSQSALIQSFSQYLKEHHGGLLVAEAIESEIVSGELTPLFRLQFRFMNQSLISELAQDFALQHEMDAVIEPGCRIYETENACHELAFLRNQSVQVRVILESIQPVTPQKGEKSHYRDTVEINGHEQPAPLPPPPQETARLAIVIDDLGYQMDVFNELITLDYDITYAVLPQQAFSRETAEIAAQAGRQVMLHLPMQPKEWPKFDPGLGALLLRDSPEEINAKIALNLSTVPFVTGVNNHMGSAFTQYEEGLEILMEALSQNALFFLDSKTAPGRTARNAAKRYQVPYLTRDIFLDNDRDADLIRRQLDKAVKLALKRGSAIAIGHPYHVTYAVLAEELPLLEAEGIRITKVIELLN